MINAFASYKKALRVIDSCTNEYHLQGARNYVNNFFASESLFVGVNKYNLREYITDEIIAEMYNRLLTKLTEKEASYEI